MKDDAVFGLLKVPDEVIIRELRVELGKANAMIDELRAEVSFISSSSTGDLLNQIKSLKGSIKQLAQERRHDEYYKKYKEQKKECTRLMRENKELVYKLFQMNLKTEEK